MPMILSAFGFVWLTELLNKKYIIYTSLLYSIVVFGLTENYLIKYFSLYRSNYSQVWQYGYKEVSSYIKDNYSKYDKIVITKKYGEPHEFLLFNLAWDPSSYREDPSLNRFYQTNWYWVDGFDKFYFVNDWQIKYKNKEFELESGQVVDCKNDTCLLVTSPENVSSGWNKLETINFLDGKPAFELYEN
jgi:hypothetical protein